jgi:hypothetical protein
MRLKNIFKSDAVEDKRADLKKYLNTLGLRPEKDYQEDDEGDIICRGAESDAFLYLSSFWRGEGDDREALFSVGAPAVHIPKNNCLAFYRRLLEISYEYPFIPISVDGDIVFVQIGRPVQGLDRAEVFWLMVQVDAMVNFLRTDIAKEFKAPLYDF